jgi:hypothetical protein
MAAFIYWVAQWARPMTDEEKFQTMRKDVQSFSEAVAEEQGRWGDVLRLLHYAKHYSNIYKSERAALLASGYLTNVTFKIPKIATERDEWNRREALLVRGTNVEIVLPIIVTETEEAITCRTQDVGKLHQVLGE